MRSIQTLLTATVFSLSLLTGLCVQAKVNKQLPDYQTTQGVSGKLNSIGSDTLANMMTLWQEAFKKLYPNVSTEIQAAGSSTAPTALIEGTANLGPMSRQMKDSEIATFENKYGYKPTPVAVAIDALAIFVHKDNPVKKLNIKQIDAVFSATRKCGAENAVNSWGDIGLKGNWSDKSIQLFGRNSASGTYGYFKKKALCKGDYKNSVNEQPGSASVVQSVSTTLNAIGYSGIGYKTANVDTVAVLNSRRGKYFNPTAYNAATGAYPLSRKLYVYVNKHPNKPLDPLIKEFLKLVLSRQGQEIVYKDGYVPLPASVVKKVFKNLSL